MRLIINFCFRLLGFEGGRLRMDERIDAAMSDMDLVPLLVQVSYLIPSGIIYLIWNLFYYLAAVLTPLNRRL